MLILRNQLHNGGALRSLLREVMEKEENMEVMKIF